MTYVLHLVISERAVNYLRASLDESLKITKIGLVVEVGSRSVRAGIGGEQFPALPVYSEASLDDGWDNADDFRWKSVVFELFGQRSGEEASGRLLTRRPHAQDGCRAGHETRWQGPA